MHRLTLTLTALAFGLAGCLNIPGTEEGGPCNSQNVCTKGLVCEEGICKTGATISWEVMLTPSTADLADVWGTGDDNLIAVGSGGTVLRYRGGSEWVDDSPRSITTSALSSVWGRGANEVWAVGAGKILQHNGTSWVEHKVPDPAKPTSFLSLSQVGGVSGGVAAGGPVYVAAMNDSKPVVFKYAGTSWTVEPAELGYQPHDLLVIGAQIFIVGQEKHVRFFNGTIWGSRSLAESMTLNALWGLNATEVLAGGTPTSGGEGKVLRFDGEAWSELRSLKSFSVRGLWGTSLEEYYVVGAGAGSYNVDPVTVYRCGASCTPGALPEPAQGKTMYGVWGTSSGTIYVVGDDGVILRRKPE